MADTPVLWAECEHGKGDDYLHYGDRSVRRVPVGALLIEDFDAAKDRLIAHAQLLGFDEFDNAALADEYADELLHAAAGEGGDDG